MFSQGMVYPCCIAWLWFDFTSDSSPFSNQINDPAKTSLSYKELGFLFISQPLFVQEMNHDI